MRIQEQSDSLRPEVELAGERPTPVRKILSERNSGLETLAPPKGPESLHKGA